MNRKGLHLSWEWRPGNVASASRPGMASLRKAKQGEFGLLVSSQRQPRMMFIISYFGLLLPHRI